jgi:hypothetical protein
VGGLQRRALLGRVGGLPEAAVAVRQQPPGPRRAGARVLHEAPALGDVVEDLRAQHEAAAVLPDRQVAQPRHGRDAVVVADPDAVERLLRGHREQGRDGVRPPEPGHHHIQRRIREDIGVVGQEQLLVGDVAAHPAQPLPDRRVDPGVHERDRPVGDVGAQHLDLAAAQHEIVRARLGVVQEVVLDVLRAVSRAQHEVGVPEMRVVAHHVPEQGSRSHGLHRFGHVGDAVAHPHPVAPAEQDDLHATTVPFLGECRRRLRRRSSNEAPPRSVTPSGAVPEKGAGSDGERVRERAGRVGAAPAGHAARR